LPSRFAPSSCGLPFSRAQGDPYRAPRYNLFSAAEVQGVSAPGIATGTALHRRRSLPQGPPEGRRFEWTDLAFQQQQRGTPTLLVFGAAALFVFLVLVAQYESWKLPLAMVLILPICLLASVTGLLARGMSIDILAQIGLVVLVGLAAKNAILIVEFARQKKRRAPPPAKPPCTRHVRASPDPDDLARIHLGVAPLAVATGAGAEMLRSLDTSVLFGMLGVTCFGPCVHAPPSTPSFASSVAGTTKQPAAIPPLELW
jgi:multidrug efflux pump subunit AcrB